MKDLKFNSLEELYERVKPALHSKIKELNRLNINYVKEEDVWNILKNKKWMNCTTLSLAEMVDDILNSDASIFIEGVQNEIKKTTKDPDIKGDSII